MRPDPRIIQCPRKFPDRTELYVQLGLNVTICIAARAWIDGRLVTISDRRISHGDVVTAVDDVALKAQRLTKSGWGALYAADDISPVRGMLRDARMRLDASGAFTAAAPEAAVVLAAVREAYRAAVQECIVARYLSRYGIKTIEEFRARVLGEFGTESIANLTQEIDKFDLGVSLLIYGFDGAVPQVFEVKNPGEVVDHNIQGFAVIGSGYWPALASLTSRDAIQELPLTTVIYRLCEAKFCAESASAVGKATTLMVFGPGGDIKQFLPEEIKKIRKAWEQERKRPVPEPAEKIIHSRLFPENKRADT